MRTLDCDAVVLFTYDARAQVLQHPPTMVGVRNVELATVGKNVMSGSLVYAMLGKKKIYQVDDTELDPLFHGRRFSRDEEIKSCAAVPLIASKGKVGVMFINYRRPHHFVKDELEDIGLFANQAAVAIRNAQLSRERTKDLSNNKALVELSNALLSATSLQEVLAGAVRVAGKVLKTPFSNIVLPNNAGELIFAAAKGWTGIEIGTSKLERHRGSQTGYIIETKKSMRVDDFRDAANVPFTVPAVVFENNIVSGMGVPMFDRDEVVGALLVHSTRKRHFNDDEESLLQLIANQTAIAIRNTQQSESLARIADLIRALTGDLGLESSSLHGLLGQIVTSLKTCYERQAIVCGSIWLYDSHRDDLTCQCVYSSTDLSRLVKEPGRVIPIGSLASADQRIGVMGRAVRTKEPQVVKDVRADQDYIEFDKRTVSEITVPLVDGGSVIGALNIESDCSIALDAEA